MAILCIALIAGVTLAAVVAVDRKYGRRYAFLKAYLAALDQVRDNNHRK